MYKRQGIGVHCDTFTTIGDAMEAMRQHTYDLMITDMKMPEINGYGAGGAAGTDAGAGTSAGQTGESAAGSIGAAEETGTVGAD